MAVRKKRCPFGVSKTTGACLKRPRASKLATKRRARAAAATASKGRTGWDYVNASDRAYSLEVHKGAVARKLRDRRTKGKKSLLSRRRAADRARVKRDQEAAAKWHK